MAWKQKGHTAHHVEHNIDAVRLDDEGYERGSDCHRVYCPAFNDDPKHWRKEAAGAVLSGPASNRPDLKRKKGLVDRVNRSSGTRVRGKGNS